MANIPVEKNGADAAGRRDASSHDGFKEMMAEQRERQGRMRHVQQFLASPLFFDLRDQPIIVSDPPEAIEQRKRDIDYRIRVLESLVTLLVEERGALDKIRSAAAPEPETPEQPAATVASDVA